MQWRASPSIGTLRRSPKIRCALCASKTLDYNSLFLHKLFYKRTLFNHKPRGNISERTLGSSLPLSPHALTGTGRRHASRGYTSLVTLTSKVNPSWVCELNGMRRQCCCGDEVCLFSSLRTPYKYAWLSNHS